MVGVRVLLAACLAGAEGDASECWGGDFTEKLCCGGRFLISGNPHCWNEEFSHARCCGVKVLPRLVDADERWEGLLARSQPAEPEEVEVDFVVVGAGSAGSVVAARLAEAQGPAGGRWRVLLVEAGSGQAPDPMEADPDNAPSSAGWWPALEAAWKLPSGTSGTWSYNSGRGLGGSATVNSMLYTRGSVSEYNAMGWSTDEVLSAYMELEAPMDMPGFDVAPGFHRPATLEHPRGYPLTLVSARRDELPGLFGALLDAFEASGVPFRLDPHGNTTIHGIGGAWRAIGCRHPARCAPTRLSRVRQACGRPRATTFLSLVAPLNATSQLQILSDAHVTRVVFDATRRAVGIDVVETSVADDDGSEEQHLRRRFVRVRKEVILSAGVFRSPQLLVLSGIGEPRDLERLGVPLVAESPEVGLNLADHVGLSIVVRTSTPCPEGSHVGADGKRTHLGDTSDFIGQLYAFVNVTSNEPGTPGPVDAEIMLLEGCMGDKLTLTFTIILLHAHSRGRVVVQSRNPLTPPVVDYQPLSHSEDIPLMMKAIRWLYANVLMHTGLARFGLQLLLPWEVVNEEGGEILKAFILQNLYFYQHPTGTNRATSTASKGVVDRRLRVRGVDGLRVADASALAVQPSGHSDGPSRLVGQLAARFLLEDHPVAPAFTSPSAVAAPRIPPAQLAPAVYLEGYDTWMPLRGLGTNGFEGEHLLSAVQRYVRLGGRLLDTGLLYGNHADIATAITTSGLPRSAFFLSSKIPPGRMGFDEATSAIDQILFELRIEYVDLVLIHWPAMFNDDRPPRCAAEAGGWPGCRRATWLAMEAAHRNGKVRALGVSNFGEGHLRDILEAPGRRLPIATNEFELTPWWPQHDLRAFCRQHGIAVTAFGSLGGSLIGGAMLNAPVVQRVAREEGRSPAQVLLRWAVQSGVAVIPSSSSQGHAEDNWDIAAWDLSAAAMRQLDAIADSEGMMKVFQPDPATAP